MKILTDEEYRAISETWFGLDKELTQRKHDLSIWEDSYNRMQKQRDRLKRWVVAAFILGMCVGLTGFILVG